MRGSAGSRLQSAVFALGFAALAANTAHAESALRMVYPEVYGVIPAATYDMQRQRVGDAHLVVEKLDDGNIRLFSESGITNGARTIASAVLAPAEGGGSLRPVLQESRSFDPQGVMLGVLSVDHRTGMASCSKPNGDGMKVDSLPLPSSDRVANVPLNLLFLPLVKGEAEELRFQLFLCGSGPRFVNFVASVAPGAVDASGRRVIEVAYGPDFGRLVSLVARHMTPKLSFWFDPAAPHRWMGHRLPLYAKGPEVFVVRKGVPAAWFADE